jgi:hypothetical protein
MPNDSRSRRDKKEKEKKRKDRKDPIPLLKELPAEEAEATSTDVDGNHSEDALAISVFFLGAKPSSKAMETSLSAFASLSSAAEGKDSSEEKRSNSLSQEDSEDGGTLSDDSEEVTSISRPLSPSQYVGTLMKPSGSRDKLFATAATVSPAKLDSTYLLLPHFDVQGGMESDSAQWQKGLLDRSNQRKSKIVNVEAGKSAGGPKPPAGSSSSSSSSSVSKQATARHVAAELIRLGDTSLSAPLLSASGTGDNLLLLQVNQESSSSVWQEFADEHALSNERKRKELQDLRGELITEKHRGEWKAMNQKAAQGKKDKEPEDEASRARPPRNLRVASIEELPGSFTAPKSVMDMQYCVRHLEGLRELAGKNDLSKFSDFWAPDHKNTTPLKSSFVPEKLVAGNEPLLARFYDGGRVTTKGETDPINPPYFRISRELMGRVIHTLRREYISDDEHGRMSEEFKAHVKEVLTPLETTLVTPATRLEEHLKASMEQHEKVVKDTHDCLVEASEKFKDALTKQVREMEKHIDRHVMKESTEALTVTARKQFRGIILGEGTNNGSFDLEASRKARKERRTYLEMELEHYNADLVKSQEEWTLERKALHEKIKCMEEEIEKLKAERDKLMDMVSAHAVRIHKRSQKQVEEKAKANKLVEDYEELDRKTKLLAKEIEREELQRKEDKEALVQGDRVLQSLRDKLKGARQERDAAVLENQDLKRKREASTSPPPSPLRILSRPQIMTPVQQTELSPARGESPPVKQPAPKKSRNRKERWANAPAANLGAPTTSTNVGGYNGKDPVLHSALTSFENKADIINQIDTSADHLNLGRNRELVFHRNTVEEQAKVIKKALAYAELVITSNGRYKMPEQPKGKQRVSYMKAYLDGMTNARVIELQKDTRRALEDQEDTNRAMAVYRDGDDLLERVRVSCFTQGPQGLLPKNAYKAVDEKTRLHAVLAFPNLYRIPVGFYYTKWMEKLDYYLRTNPERSATPSSIASSSAAAPSAERLALMEKRAAIFEDKADDDLTAKDKAVYKYRVERKRQWNSFSGSTTLSEQQYNEQYDEEQLAGVKKSLATLNETGTPKQRKTGDGSTEQARR